MKICLYAIPCSSENMVTMITSLILISYWDMTQIKTYNLKSPRVKSKDHWQATKSVVDNLNDSTRKKLFRALIRQSFYWIKLKDISTPVESPLLKYSSTKEALIHMEVIQGTLWQLFLWNNLQKSCNLANKMALIKEA